MLILPLECIQRMYKQFPNQFGQIFKNSSISLRRVLELKLKVISKIHKK
jgi:hypothetical protein